MNWRTAYEVVGPNVVSRTCAVVSIVSIFLPWLILRDWSISFPPNPSGLIVDYFATRPPERYPLIEMAARHFVSVFYTIPPAISMAALVFIAGAIISWWSAVGGILQVGSVYAIAISLIRNDYLLISGGVLEAEYGFSIGFHIGFAAALVTVFSLCPSGRSALIKGFRIARRRVWPQPT